MHGDTSPPFDGIIVLPAWVQVALSRAMAHYPELAKEFEGTLEAKVGRCPVLHCTVLHCDVM